MNNKLRISNVALAMIVAMFISFTADIFAQDFINSGAGAVYNASCTGVIRMKCNVGKIDTTNLSLIGKNAANYIQGTVEWSSTDAGQTVKPYYYQRLAVSGSTKTMLDGIHVLGDPVGNTCSTSPVGYPADYPASNGYYVLGAGDRTYQGTFFYDGATAQVVYPESGGSGPNAYNTLELTGAGGKTIAGNVRVIDHMATTVTPLTISGNNTTLTLGGNASTFNGTVELNAPTGSIIMAAGSAQFNQNITVTNGTFNIGSGSGDVTVGYNATLALANSANAILSLANDENLYITGSMTNGLAAGTNVNFGCSSNVYYDSTSTTFAQTIMHTAYTNPYGNLILKNSSKTAGDSITICNNFSLAGGNLTMGDYTLAMLASTGFTTGLVTYGVSNHATDNEEVIGRFMRYTNNTSTTPYMFNNRNTAITLAANTNNPSKLTMNVLPGTNPNGYNATKDVKRKISIAYSGNAGEYPSSVKVGYLFDEGPVATTRWDATYAQNTIRFWETSSLPDSEKVGTGSLYQYTEAASTILGAVELGGIKSATSGTLPNGIEKFASGNDLVLRSGPTTFYTVQNGRWSNPNIWDEGIYPGLNDAVEIRYANYVGIRGGIAGTTLPGTGDVTATNNGKTEASIYTGSAAAAKSITIASGAFWPNASLIIGNEDNGDYTFRTNTTNSGITFTNNNTNTMSLMTLTKTTVAAALNGLYITNQFSGTNTSIFETNMLMNKGSVNNEGVLEVGTVCP